MLKQDGPLSDNANAYPVRLTLYQAAITPRKRVSHSAWSKCETGKQLDKQMY
uniref:Uncharacterized protein n=1 Tax=Rhizophora mucronata TaxID=61149 RepID=A0A2P2P4G4_RHIMU